jgi:membrane-bound ClpP family serine protease
MLEWLSIILLILVGLIFIVVELIFIPGTTLIGVLGFIMTLMGIVISFQSFGSLIGFIVLASSFGVCVLAIMYGFNNDSWQKFALKTAIDNKVNDEIPLDILVGAEGKSVSALKPFGKAEIAHRIYEVKTNGNYLDAGKKIRVIKVEDQRIIVESIV